MVQLGLFSSLFPQGAKLFNMHQPSTGGYVCIVPTELSALGPRRSFQEGGASTFLCPSVRVGSVWEGDAALRRRHSQSKEVGGSCQVRAPQFILIPLKI